MASGSRIVEIQSWNDFYDQLFVLKQLHEAVAYSLKIKNQWTTVRQIQTVILRDPKKAMEWYGQYSRRAA